MWGSYSGLTARTAVANDKGNPIRDAVADGGGVHVFGVDNTGRPVDYYVEAQDLRTGVIQSEMLYKSLKILEKPVEYIRYPREGHELTRSGNPGRMMDHMLRVIEFFERYTKHPEPAPATLK